MDRRRCAGRTAGRQPAAAVRTACGNPYYDRVLLLCVSLYIFDVTPAEVWVWLCAVTGGVHARGAAFASRAPPAAPSVPPSGRQRGDRRGIRRNRGRAAGRGGWSLPGCIWVPDWTGRSGVLGPLGTDKMEGRRWRQTLRTARRYCARRPCPAGACCPAHHPGAGQRCPSPAAFDVDLGPDHTEVKEGGSEPIEPLIVGPGGTFGQNPLRPAPRPAPQPIVAGRGSHRCGRFLCQSRTRCSRKSPAFAPRF